jgi:hypothetical protein
VTQRRPGTVTRPSTVTAALQVTNGRPRTPGEGLLRELDLDPRFGQAGETAPVGLRVRVLRANDHARDACRGDRLRAGGSAPVMGAGLEGDVEDGAARALAGGSERRHLGVRPARTLVPALADDFVPGGDDRSDHGVRLSGSASALGELERPLKQAHRAP